MTNIKGWLVERDGRALFLRELVDWAADDPEYTVTPLVAMHDNQVSPSTDDTQERIQLMNELFDLQETEIAQLKHSLEEAVELVETIHEFASKQTNNIMESRGLLLLICESCDKWLKPK